MMLSSFIIEISHRDIACCLTCTRYGEMTNVGFQPARASLLERGWAMGWAHVRGGGELGRRWYEEGRQLAKKNSVFDFVRVTEELVSRNYTRPPLTAATAGSAGGLMLGAARRCSPFLCSPVCAQELWPTCGQSCITPWC